jgi:hypothetical protein
MEEIIQKVKYPNTSLTLCSHSPITRGEIEALLDELAGEPTFRGVWTINGDGLPVAILHAIDKRNIRDAKNCMNGVLAWNWPHQFGRLFSFSIVGFQKQRYPRMFLPDDSVLVRRVAERGKIAFAIAHNRELSSFYLADFTSHPQYPEMLHALRALLRFEDNEQFVFRDDELAFWLLMADSNMNWHKDLSLRDAMSARWAFSYKFELRTFIRTFEDMQSRKLTEPYVDKKAVSNITKEMPFFDEVVRFLVRPSVSPPDVISLLLAGLSDPRKIDDLFRGMLAAFDEDFLAEPLKWVVNHSFWATLLSPFSTNSGLRRPWLDGRFEPGNIIVRYLDLDLSALGEQAREYWAAFEFNEGFDLGYVVTGKEAPIPRIGLYKELADLKLDCKIEEADQAIRDLLEEARENRQWSAPWGARVQIDIGSLKYLDIYELEGEFIGLFRDRDERFLMVPVSVLTGKYSPPMVLRADDDLNNVEENAQAALALVLVLASVVRDFLVVEERQAQFVAKSAMRSRCATNQALSVIYLPRVRYLNPNINNFQEKFIEGIVRSPHNVGAHLRKAEKPSPGQLLIAMRYGFNVPRGYTFVRPHRRGDLAGQQRQRIYRSRSASSILYKVLSSVPSGTRPAWFDFEKDVAVLMGGKGLTVVHQAASRHGDGGVDIYAHDELNDKIWAIQCKCYAPNRKVGPGVVRELAGSLHRYPEGTRGMIVTTSSFTPKAVEEAGALNIEIVDGDKFATFLEIRGHLT